MTDFNIRSIQEKDNAGLAQIIRNSFEEFSVPTHGTVYEDPTTDNLLLLFQTKGAICWVAESNNIVMGCCGLFPTEGLPNGCVELVKFYLASSARGKGVGKALFQKCLESATILGYRQVYVESLPQFNTAVSMYAKEGFKKINHPLGNSGHSGCNIWMVKDL